MIKYLIPLLITTSCFAQDEVEANTFKPYLIEDDSLNHTVTITGANTFSKNRQLGETNVDTIFCLVEIVDSLSGVKMGSKSTGLVGYVGIWVNAYGLWVKDATIGDHWDLFTADRKFRLLRSLPVTITRIIELKGTSRKSSYKKVISEEGLSEITVEDSSGLEIEVR